MYSKYLSGLLYVRGRASIIQSMLDRASTNGASCSALCLCTVLYCPVLYIRIPLSQPGGVCLTKARAEAVQTKQPELGDIGAA